MCSYRNAYAVSRSRRLDLANGTAYLADWVQEGGWTLFHFFISDSDLRAGATLNEIVGELLYCFLSRGIWVGEIHRERDTSRHLWEIILRVYEEA